MSVGNTVACERRTHDEPAKLLVGDVVEQTAARSKITHIQVAFVRRLSADSVWDHLTSPERGSWRGEFPNQNAQLTTHTTWRGSGLSHSANPRKE